MLLVSADVCGRGDCVTVPKSVCFKEAKVNTNLNTKLLDSYCGTRLVESSPQELNSSDINWLRCLFLYLIKLSLGIHIFKLEFLWNKKRKLKKENRIFFSYRLLGNVLKRRT